MPMKRSIKKVKLRSLTERVLTAFISCVIPEKEIINIPIKPKISSIIFTNSLFTIFLFHDVSFTSTFKFKSLIIFLI